MVREIHKRTGTCTASVSTPASDWRGDSTVIAASPPGTSSSPSSSEESGESRAPWFTHAAWLEPPATRPQVRLNDPGTPSAAAGAAACSSSGRPPHTTSVDTTRATLSRAHEDRRVVTALPQNPCVEQAED